MSKKIAIIGGGNLGVLLPTVIMSEFSRPVEITITRRNLSPLARFAERGCIVHSDNKKAVKDAEVIILAVKPYNYADIIKEIKPLLNPKKHIVVSVITGVWIVHLQKEIAKPVPVIRAMPNTAIASQPRRCPSYAPNAVNNGSIAAYPSTGGTASPIHFVIALRAGSCPFTTKQKLSGNA
jgi:pyrroline-5-carboxylate reductase